MLIYFLEHFFMNSIYSDINYAQVWSLVLEKSSLFPTISVWLHKGLELFLIHKYIINML